MDRGTKLFWALLALLLASSAWFASGVVRMQSGRDPVERGP